MPSRRVWALVVVVVGLAILLGLFATDAATMQWIQDFRDEDSSGVDWLGRFLDWTEVYAKGLGVGLFVVGIFVFDRRRRGRAIALLVIVLTVSIGNSVLKAVLGRVRPDKCRSDYEKVQEGDSPPENISRPYDRRYEVKFVGPVLGVQHGKFQSFPSGHTVAATAQTVVLSAAYPQAAPVFYGLLTFVGFERVYHEKHFFSDVFGAFMLGFFATRWLLRRRGLLRLCQRVADWLAFWKRKPAP